MRKNRVISVKQSSNIRVGMNAAKDMGHTFTDWLVINFSNSDCNDEHVAKEIFRHLRNQRFCKWITRPPRRDEFAPTKPVDVFVWEKPNGILHVNWAMCLPQAASSLLEEKVRGWLAQTGYEFDERAVHRKRVTNPAGLALYFLKGSDEKYDPQKINHSDQGEIYGRRASLSRALNRTARKAAGVRVPRRFGPAYP